MKVEILATTSNAEQIIEEAGRTCYQSTPKEGYVHGTLIKALIKSGHESVLEHASATVRINGVSRSLTHQLVRHRIASFSQQSQRYVKEDQFEYVIPDDIIQMGKEMIDEFSHDMQKIQLMYNYWKDMGLKNEDARFVLPNACCSEIVMTANFREWRTIFNVRCDKHAQWEIRKMCKEILRQFSTLFPNVFEDLKEKFLNE